MALTISTGFVVDDAIVVMENITRHLEEGMTPMAATLQGAREIGFTVLSISISLIAVFIPLLLMGGIVGRLFREFAITLSTAIAVSMVISLTTTPMMCAYLLKRRARSDPRSSLHGQRALLRRCAQPVPQDAALGVGESRAHPGRSSSSPSRSTSPWSSRFPRASSRSRIRARSRAACRDLRMPRSRLDERLAAEDPGGHQTGSGRSERDRLHRRRWRHQHGEHLRHLEAAGQRQGRAQDRRGGHHQPAPSQAQPSAGCIRVPAGIAGSSHRRPWKQCDVSVHHPGRQRGRP